MTRIRIGRDTHSGSWLAYVDGHGAPVLRPVPGNTHPARRAEWHTFEAARDELLSMFPGCNLEIVMGFRK